MTWACGIDGCGRRFDAPTGVIRHQAVDHAGCDCAVCGRRLPAGYLAIKHAFEEHTRAEYVRAYNANSDEIRLREQVLERVEDRVDVAAVVNGIEADGESAVSVSD